jgi:hypothetical protein
MYKKLALAAFAAVSTCALAQTGVTGNTHIGEPQQIGQPGVNWNDRYDSRWNVDVRTLPMHEQRAFVTDFARTAINAGDAYILTRMLDRAPGHVTMNLVNALAQTTWQARAMRQEWAMSRYGTPVAGMPQQQTTFTTTVTNPDGTVTTTTTTTSTAQTMAWAGNRPMRMIIERQSPGITYLEALEVLTANLTNSETAVLANWWHNQATERERDSIVRLIRANAGIRL